MLKKVKKYRSRFSFSMLFVIFVNNKVLLIMYTLVYFVISPEKYDVVLPFQIGSLLEMTRGFLKPMINTNRNHKSPQNCNLHNMHSTHAKSYPKKLCRMSI